MVVIVTQVEELILDYWSNTLHIADYGRTRNWKWLTFGVSKLLPALDQCTSALADYDEAHNEAQFFFERQSLLL